MELRDDLFIIPVAEGNIVYSPLRRGVFWASDNASQVAIKFLNDGKLDPSSDDKVQKYLCALSEAKVRIPVRNEIPSKNRLVIILSQICNLACTYCYAHEARSKEILSKDKLKVAYDATLADENKSKHFSFIGGGEPFVTWDIIEWSINYINSHKANEDKVSFSITTNTTLFNEHSIKFCKEHNIHIGVSFEIVKEIQDNQRPFYKSDASTFDVIHKNLGLLIENGISFGIRSTITKLNVALMPEMVNFVADNYPNQKRLHFEQVTDPSQNNTEFYNEFVEYFFKAREIGKKRGVEVYNSISNSVFRIRERFCNGETCITPTGSIVACHRISSEKDKDYTTFNYGQIDTDSLFFDMSKYQRYLDFAHEKMPECNGCYAYWHCAGICPMERTALSREQLLTKCEFTKEIVKRILMEKIVKSNK